MSGSSRWFVLILAAAAFQVSFRSSLAAQGVRFEARGEGAAGSEPVLAGLNQVIKPAIHIVNPSGAESVGVQAFQMAVTHDPAFLDFQSATWKGTALDVAGLRNFLGPETFLISEVTTGGASGFILGVVFQQQNPNFMLLPGDHKVVILSYRAAATTPPGTPTRIEFPALFGEPPIPNLVIDFATGDERAATGIGLAVTVGQEQAYAVAFRDPRVTVEPTAEVVAPILVQNSPSPVHGFSFGVKHDAAMLDLLDVTLSQELRTQLGGSADPRFLAINKAPAGGSGFTVALILGPEDSGPSKALNPLTSPHHVVDARYRPRAGNITTDLEVTGTLGQPRVEVILDLSGIAQRPLPPSQNPLPTKLTVQVSSGTQDQRFIRGDLDQNGRITITDSVGLLRYLFDGANLLPVFRPTVQNCLIAFNIDGNTAATGIEESNNININDPVYLLNYSFLDGPPPATPFGTSCAVYGGQASERMKCVLFTCP